MASQGILKQGFLVKKGHVRHNWRTRWFVLMRKELSYFKKKQDRFPAGIIPLVGAALACPPPEDTKKPWLLQLTTHEGREFLIQAPDHESRDEWKELIEDCIRRLDPAKIDKEMSPTRTLARTDTYAAISDDIRDVVQAMQDPNAGLKLHEMKAKGARQTTRYFTGKELLDWLITWSFANDRSEASSMATQMLRYGFFHPVRLDREEGVCVKLRKDSVLDNDIVDTEDATYIFVVFAPGTSLDVFQSGDWDDDEGEYSDGDSDHDSDSDDDILSNRARISIHSDISGSGIDMGDGKILKQGFLLKKGQFRHNWKARKFVLKEKNPLLYYFRGSKDSKPLGSIPLKDLTVTSLDDTGSPTLTTTPTSGSDTLPAGSGCVPIKPRQRTKPKVNRFLLITTNGVRYELQATNADEREAWLSQLKIAAKLA